MSTVTPADTLHRLMKLALDSGQASSIADAEAIFLGYRLALRLDDSEANDPHHQAALLTAIALARRVFLGGVTLEATRDAPLSSELASFGSSLIDAAERLGAQRNAAPKGAPLIEFGGRPCKGKGTFHVRVLFTGWRGGFVRADCDVQLASAVTMPLAPMLASALAINEAFLFVSGDPFAGRRSVGMSLWDPATSDWLQIDEAEPALQALPSRLWLVGLGHLGQAYLWALGLLPYAAPADVHMVLQDVDAITPSTESTSILTDGAMVGTKKTRAMASWAERRGFSTAIYERTFERTLRRQSDEPAVALCGIDNALGRRALDEVGFDFVVEAGLGRGYRDFRAIRLHTLPASRKAVDIWSDQASNEDLVDRPAYAALLRSGLDRCGVTLLAGKAVGAPFVGSVAAALAVAEILRLLHGGAVHELIDLDLKDIDHRTAVVSQRSFAGFNPGFVAAAGQPSQAAREGDSGSADQIMTASARGD